MTLLGEDLRGSSGSLRDLYHWMRPAIDWIDGYLRIYATHNWETIQAFHDGLMQHNGDLSIHHHRMTMALTLGVAVICALIAAEVCGRLLDIAGPKMLEKGISGIDVHRVNKPRIPESLGIVVSLCFVTMGYVFAITARIVNAVAFSTSDYDYKGKGVTAHFNAAVNGITLITMYGILDDIVEFGWLSKCLLPIAPYLLASFDYSGPTAVLLPQALKDRLADSFHRLGCDPEGTYPIQWLTTETTRAVVTEVVDQSLQNPVGLAVIAKEAPSVLHSYPMLCLKSYPDGRAMDFGWLFLIYGLLVYIFSTNSINIYAGINGLEVGQSLVIAVFMLVHVLYAAWNTSEDHELFWCASLLILFIAVNIPFFRRNKYPAKVFGGNAYTSFSGVFFASLAFLGRQNRIILPLFLPQVVNFVMSLPQLLKVIPCPRHRMPGVILVEDHRWYHQLYRFPKDKNEASSKVERLVATPNLTLPNAVLYLTGPISERSLLWILLSIQIVTGIGVFAVAQTWSMR